MISIHFSRSIYYLTTEWKKSPQTVITVGLTALPAIEMAFRGMLNLVDKYSKKHSPGSLSEINWRASGNLGGALFFGACASYPSPVVRLLGATAFTGYSLFIADRERKGQESSYLSSRCLYVPFDCVVRYPILSLITFISVGILFRNKLSFLH